MAKFTDTFTGTNGDPPSANWIVDYLGTVGNTIDIQGNALRSFYNSGGTGFKIEAAAADADGLGTDYTIKVRVDELGVPVQFLVYDGAGKAHGIVFGGASPDNKATVLFWDGSSQTSPGTDYTIAIDTWYYLKINCGATNVVIAMSTDGVNWTNLYSGAKVTGYNAASLKPVLFFSTSSTLATGVTWLFDDYNILPGASSGKYFYLSLIRGQ